MHSGRKAGTERPRKRDARPFHLTAKIQTVTYVAVGVGLLIINVGSSATAVRSASVIDGTAVTPTPFDGGVYFRSNGLPFRSFSDNNGGSAAGISSCSWAAFCAAPNGAECIDRPAARVCESFLEHKKHAPHPDR